MSSIQIRPPLATPRHILLVEDNPGDADLTCERLEEASTHKFEVSRAASLADAIRLLASPTPIDAIILDLDLPDSQGVDTVRRIRIVLGDAPIIAISGQVDDLLRHRARREGAEDLFDKGEANSRLFWRSVLQIIDRHHAQQRQFQALLDATPDAILLAGTGGVVRYVNQAAVEMFGRSREDLLGEPLAFSVHDDDPSEITILRGTEERSCEMRVVKIEWDDAPAWLASIRDVTERRRSEELQARSRELEFENRRIEAANRLKSLFLANMSHELRTPLNAIIGFSQLLDDGLVDSSSPKHHEFLGYILSSGHHLLKLINDVLDLAKVESGKITFLAERVDLQRLTQDVVTTVDVLATKKQVRIDVEFDRSLDHIEIDPGRYKQVLYNYLSNAIKFTPEGGRVQVCVRGHEEDTFRLEVRDHGIGIAPADIPKLFIEFHQLDAGASKRHQGTGLGLALTKRIVEAQGGWVGVNSVVGHGSEFFAVLPRVARVQEASE